jgi:gliding motility-associated-like protein
VVLKNTFNCDSTVTLNLTVLDAKKATISRTICAEGSVTIGDQTYNQSGTFTKVVKAAGGCDSTVTLQLNVLKRNENIITQTLCFGGKYTYKGKDYTQTGTYDLEKFKAANGCDSTMVLKLLVLPDYSNMKEEKTICSNQSVVFGDKIVNTAGVYSYLYKSKYLNLACDSFVTLTLKIDKRKETKQKKVVCTGEKVTVGNQTFDKTGIFEVSYAVGTNCDSVLILDLTVRPEVLQINRKDTICEKTSVTIAGQTFDKEGVYTFTKKYPEGCDSAKITAEIVVIRPNPKPENVFVCKGDSAVYKGVKYAIGTYNRDTVRNVLGCIITWTTLNVAKKTISATVTTSSELCEGKCNGTAKVDAVINATAPVTYVWSNGNTTDALDKLCKGTYAVTVSDKDGCTNVQTATINSQEPAFAANTVTKATACDAAKTGEISLTVLPTNGTYTYTWSNGEKSKDIIKLPKGNYSVTIEDKDGCKRVLKDISVNVNPTPPFSISIPSQTDTLIVGQSKDIAITVAPPVFVTYQWTPQDGVSQKDLSNIFNIKTTKAGDITYSWTAKDANGCEAKANITLYVRNIQIPSIFTPAVENIDGFIQPFPNPADKRYELQNFQIFNRWGTLVYDTKADKGWWNGKMHNTGDDLASDVYVYVFTYQVNGVNTPVTIKGDITLVR